MSLQLNHTIVWCRDKKRSTTFITDLLGLPEAKPFGPFLIVEADNAVSLDYHEIDGDIASQHYAFLISEPDFDDVYRRITERGIDHWADPGLSQQGTINHHDGGRGVYFEDPDGHLLEAITRPYGSGG